MRSSTRQLKKKENTEVQDLFECVLVYHGADLGGWYEGKGFGDTEEIKMYERMVWMLNFCIGITILPNFI